MFLVIAAARAQVTDSTSVKNDTLKQVAVNDSAGQKVLGDKPEVVSKGDTTHIRLGKKNITIVKKDGMTNVQIENNDKVSKGQEANEDNEDNIDNSEYNDHDYPRFKPFKRKGNSNKFDPHWGGLELTLNNFMTKDYSFNLPKESQFMELNAGRSIGVNLNLMEYAIPFSSKMGITTGLGFEFNSYYFDSDTNNIKKENGYIVPKVKDRNSGDYSKNKLKDTYLTIPLIYEIQFPLGNHKRPLYFAAGVIGGLKLGSTTKEYYQIDGNDKKDIVRGDFYMSPIRYGFQARVGFRRIHLVATYYESPLFRSGKGPEIHPFDIGLMLLNW